MYRLFQKKDNFCRSYRPSDCRTLHIGRYLLISQSTMQYIMIIVLLQSTINIGQKIIKLLASNTVFELKLGKTLSNQLMKIMFVQLIPLSKMENSTSQPSVQFYALLLLNERIKKGFQFNNCSDISRQVLKRLRLE